MDFADQLSALAARTHKLVEHLQTEEATKNALVMPFINALGYNVFDPTEVVPEFVSDVGTKKGEKVDYVIMREGKPIMLIECKHAGGDLSLRHASQLFRYFTVTEARIAALTNGIQYRFFTDLESPNKMDERPFLEFDLFNIQDGIVSELKKLTKSAFDLDEMLSAAHDLKYTKALKVYLADQWAAPSEEFVKFMTKQVYDGIVTQSVRAQFTDIVRRALHQFVSERISDRLKSALQEEQQEARLPEPSTEAAPDDGIETTREEMEGYHIIRAILREIVDVSRIAHRDVKSYFGVLLDNNNRKPICRLHLNTTQWYLGLFDKNKNEERVPIASLDEIYKYADRLKETVGYYEES